MTRNRTAPGDGSGQPGRVIRAAVIHGNAVMRQSLGTLLGQQPDLYLVGLFASTDELLADPPDGDNILVYDLETARKDGASLVMGLHAKLPQSRVLMINVSDDDESILECARAGVAGCILDDVSFDDLMIAIRSLSMGSLPASPRIITSLYNYIANHQAEDERMPAAELTPREQQVLELIAEGLSNKEIARRLFLQPQTVKNYVRLVFEKLGVHNRLAVMRLLRSERRR
jgi:DNA-binding NarL/FixJ family response regulator